MDERTVGERPDVLGPDQPYEVPEHERLELRQRATRFAVVVPVINEGDRIRSQLQRMAHQAELADIIIADGGSTDGSLDPGFLASCGVRALLVKWGPGHLSAQLRMAFGYALEQGYDGVITVDGNGKDGVEAIDRFIEALDAGFDFVQGSRFMRGGFHQNTPWSRLVAIRAIHAPVSSWLARYRYTDTTNGFRGHSARMLADPRLAVFREVFDRYELLVYLSVRSARLGFQVTEIPVSRVYPAAGPTPTKLHGLAGATELLGVLARMARHRYDP
ncbi:MAG: glycosyltransferase family 2 protein [Acidimicrobiales bacterium]|nr:glycosyltransferase family 2 protein [Acidimicrobiales bacterium]